jgi:hypothetical protein
MDTPPPPENYSSWLAYAIASMDVRSACLDQIFDNEDAPSYDAIREAAQAELDDLLKKSALPGYRMLNSWQKQLSKHVARSANDVIENGLLASDFPSESVHIQFEEGSELTFRRAFYLGDIPADGSINRIAVFTEHCGYHEFWVGPADQISILSTA